MSKPDKTVNKGRRAKLSPEELAERKKAREVARLAMKDWSPEKRLEWRANNFRTVGTRRINRAVAVVKLLANLANKSNYHATDEQKATLLKHLRDAVDHVELAFAKISKSVQKITL